MGQTCKGGFRDPGPFGDDVAPRPKMHARILNMVTKRHGRRAKVPKINKSSSSRNQSLYDSSFAVLGPKLWNCLPSHLHEIAVMDAFKHELTIFLKPSQITRLLVAT